MLTWYCYRLKSASASIDYISNMFRSNVLINEKLIICVIIFIVERR